MAKNDFKAFATDRNANVMSQEEWEALPALLSGFTAGKASSAQVNKVIRQASFIAAALAQFVSDKTQRDVLDNGDLPGFVELLGSGFAVEYLSRKNPFGDIKSDDTVKTALENLGLGETINLAAGALQKSQNGGDIPDKKQFARTIGAVTSTTITLGESGWFKIATVVMPQATSTAVIKLYGGAGFNAGSPEQAAISELVLRAGNGSPVGITATLWRRSPAAANEVAWVNTSGDTYDIYINIGQYAY
ncbi:phage tail protein, partial [Salmonella enterica]